MKLFARLAAAALCAAPFVVPALAEVPGQPASHVLQALEGEELKADKTYAAGTRVKSTALGISFKVPEGMKLSFDSSSGLLVLKPGGAERVGVIILRTGFTTDDAKATLGEELDLTFLHEAAWGQRTSGPTVSGDGVSWGFEGDAYGRAKAVCKSTASFMFAVFDASDTKAKELVKSFEDNFVFGTPDLAELRKTWNSVIVGQRLSNKEAGITVDCRADGGFTLKSQGGNQEGKYTIEFSPFGALLVMRSGGQSGAATLAWDGKNLLVDGSPFTRESLGGGKSPDVPGTPAKEERPAEADDKGKRRKLERDGNWKSDVKEVATLEGDDMRVGVAHEGGKRVKVEWLGISFMVPAGFRGATDGKTPVFIVVEPAGRGLALVYMQTGVNHAADAAALMSDDIDVNGDGKVVLKANGKPTVEGGRVTVDYTHTEYAARGVTVIGPSGNAVNFVLLGGANDAEWIRSTVKGMADSAQFKKPQAEDKRAEVKKLLGGKCLHVFRYKAVNAGSGNSSSWETNIWFHLGSDNTYYYRYKYVSSHSVEGRDSGGDTTHTGGAWSDNDREDTGTWRMEFNISGIVLILKSSTGEESVHQLRQEGSKVFVNGEEVSVFQSDKKQ